MKAVCLLSGGIDSPVAAYMIGRQGVDLTLLHMDNRPYTDESTLVKVVELAGILQRKLGREVQLYSSPHGRNQAIVSEKAKRSFQCVLCKRLMLCTAQAFAREMGADALVTGESLGQVASQTLPNMMAEQRGIKMPVLRPLIGLDKLEIESIGKEIGTYPVSIRRGTPCTIVPERPMTMTSREEMEEEESKLDLDEMIGYAAKNVQCIRIPSTPCQDRISYP